MTTLELDGKSLTLEQIEDVAYGKKTVSLSKDARLKVKQCRKIVEELTKNPTPIYGLNTGFGSLSQIKIKPEQTKELQLNLIRSHATGIGELLCPEQTRAIMLLRANVLAAGHSGVREEIIDLILACLNQNILPLIPQKGSVGASGDLAPLAHLALLLIGEGDCFFQGKKISSAQALSATKLSPVTLESKEGLALINGTQVMTGIGALILLRSERLVRMADIAGALTIEATRGSFHPFDPKIDSVRPFHGSRECASFLRKLGEDSEINKSHEGCLRIQDPYSLRCIPQVHGSVRDALTFIRQQFSIEINSVTDNPIVFVQEKEILSGGNFHGQPIAMALDFLGIAISELASISERRIEKLMIPQFSQLPPFLTQQSGLHSGFSMVQVSAASLVSENKVLTHPASVDSIPTWGDKEDHVSMGVTAANKALKILENVEYVIAMELLCAAQGIDLLTPLKPGNALQVVIQEIRHAIPFLKDDRPLSHDIEILKNMVQRGIFLRVVEKELGSPS